MASSTTAVAYTFSIDTMFKPTDSTAKGKPSMFVATLQKNKAFTCDSILIGWVGCHMTISIERITCKHHDSTFEFLILTCLECNVLELARSYWQVLLAGLVAT